MGLPTLEEKLVNVIWNRCILLVKILQKFHKEEVATWELENEMLEKYP